MKTNIILRVWKKSMIGLFPILLITLTVFLPYFASTPVDAATTYIFTTFKGDAAADEKLWVYTSTDAVNFNLLSNTGYGGPTGVLRDPSIMKHTDGKYYIAHTVQSWTTSSTYFAIASSSDLINWTNVTTVNAGVSGTYYTWAPEFFIDDGVVKLIVSLGPQGSSFKPYVYTAQNSTLTSWSGPMALGYGPNYIDTFVVKSGSIYHSFVKNETTKYIEHATASSLTGPWTFIGTGNWAGWGSGLEGPAVIQLDDGTWRIYMDAYPGGSLRTATSPDLNSWTGISTVGVSPSGIVRHGTVMKETDGATPTPTPTPIPPQTDPVTWYKFDETSGTTAYDSSGYGKNATLVNGPTWVAGRSGNAVNLDGSNDYVSMPSGIVSGLNDFTIANWVKLDTISMWSRIFDFGTGTNVNMFLTPSGGSNVIRYGITTGSYGAEQQINGMSALPTGSWQHVAVTLSGSLGILYVNGAEVGRNSGMTLKPSSLGATGNNYIGKSQYADPYLDGQVDDFRIYNRALSAAEIQSLAVGGGSTPAPTPTPTPTVPGPTATPTPTPTPTPTGTTNLALNKTASASSSQSANPASRGNDGSTTTRWCANNGNTNHWWKVNLGSSSNITSSEVMWEFSGRVYKYKVETSTDNTNWTLRVDKTNNTSTDQLQTDPFTATARYVRITVTGLASGTWASFFEFRVFGN